MTAVTAPRHRAEIDRNILEACERLGAIALSAQIGLHLDVGAVENAAVGLQRLCTERRILDRANPREACGLDGEAA